MKRSHSGPRVAVGVSLCVCLLVDAAVEAQDAGAADVCQRWTADRANLSEGTSTAVVSTCTAGAWMAPGPANSLRLVNLYRYLAAMPAVTEDSSYDGYAQSCALLQAANAASGLTHTPDASAACYSSMAATGSAHSSVCGGQGVACIDLYMSDNGSAEMGHRRWMLANYLGPVGFGSVGTGGSMSASCFYQPQGTSNAHMAFVAWPTPGNVPLQALKTTTADTAGWSIQSDTINLTAAAVSVTDGTANSPVTVTALPQNYGSTYALRVLPSGWTSQGGHHYAVSVTGISSPINYTVDVVDCTTLDAGASSVDAGSVDSGSAAGGNPGDAGTADAAGGSGTPMDAGGSMGAGGPTDASPPDASAVDATTGAGSSGGASGGAFGAGSSSGGCGCVSAGAPSVPGRAWVPMALVALLGLRQRGRGRRVAKGGKSLPPALSQGHVAEAKSI